MDRERLYTITEMAAELEIAVSTARYYRDRFKHYMPTIKKGNKKLYDREALEALQIISEGLRGGDSAEVVEDRLSSSYSKTIDQEDRALIEQQPSFSLELYKRDIESRQLLAESLQALIKQIAEQNNKTAEQNKAIYSLIEDKRKTEKQRDSSGRLAEALQIMNEQRERLLEQEKTEEELQALRQDLATIKRQLQDLGEKRPRRKWWQRLKG